MLKSAAKELAAKELADAINHACAVYGKRPSYRNGYLVTMPRDPLCTALRLGSDLSEPEINEVCISHNESTEFKSFRIMCKDCRGYRNSHSYGQNSPICQIDCWNTQSLCETLKCEDKQFENTAFCSKCLQKHQ